MAGLLLVRAAPLLEEKGTSARRHARLDTEILGRRKAVYEAAKRRNPDRWSGETRNWEPVKTVDLNPEKPPPKEAA